MYKFSSYYLDDPIVAGRCFDVFVPQKITQKTALFFIHGGGWTNGGRDRYHTIIPQFCQRGFVCATTDYRLLSTSLSDKLTTVDQIRDVREAYDGFVSVLKEMQITPLIAVFGSSAGSHLASLLVCGEPGECQEECRLVNPWVKPLCGLLQATPASFEPWPESYPAMWSMMERAAGGIYDEVPEKFRNLSLNRLIRKDNPPLFFMEAENEECFPSHYNKELLEKHKAWGIPSQMKIYRYAEHGFFYGLTRPCQLEAFEDILDFVVRMSTAAQPK